MRIDILTLFPEMFAPLYSSILGRAVKGNKLELNVVNIRDYAQNKHKSVDDTPFGGGAGMVMTCQPVYDAVMALDPTHEARRIYLSPKGRTLTQAAVMEYSKSYTRLLLLCGHYEGIDQRVLDMLVDEELSVGDYVLTGGELPAMVLVDAVARYLPEVLHASESVEEESFSASLLEYPHYTKPAEWQGVKVPEVLLSGDHAKIAAWRKRMAEEETAKKRPDLYQKYITSEPYLKEEAARIKREKRRQQRLAKKKKDEE